MASALYSSAGAHPRWNAAARSGSNASSSAFGEAADAAAAAAPAAVSLVPGGQAVLAVSGPASAAAAAAAALPELTPRTRLKPAGGAAAGAPAAAAAPQGLANPVLIPSATLTGPSLTPSIRVSERAPLVGRRVSFETGAPVTRRSGSNASAGSGRLWRRSSGGSGRPSGHRLSGAELREEPEALAASGPRFSVDSAFTQVGCATAGSAGS